MTGEKYRPLREHLDHSPPDEPVELRFIDIAALVGGLPPSSADRTWWGNTTNARRSQAHAWMGVGRRVEAVDVGRGTVRFSTVVDEPSATYADSPKPLGTRGAPPVLDGVRALLDVIARAGYPTLEHAVAATTVFLHPDTVAQTSGHALFPVVRNPSRRGSIETVGARRVLLDDNTSPTRAFLWAARRTKGLDVQFNHLWGDPQNPDTYTALWNLCVTPAFLAKTTDGSNHPGVVALLRNRSQQLYGPLPVGVQAALQPEVDTPFEWAPFPPPVDDLEAELRRRMRAAPKSRPAVAAREIGWYFSGWHPDPTLVPRA